MHLKKSGSLGPHHLEASSRQRKVETYLLSEPKALISQPLTRQRAAKRSTRRTRQSSSVTGRFAVWPNRFAICLSTRSILTKTCSMSRATHPITQSTPGHRSRTHSDWRSLQCPTWSTVRRRSPTRTPSCNIWQTHTHLSFSARIQTRGVRWILSTLKWKRSSRRRRDHATLKLTSQLLLLKPRWKSLRSSNTWARMTICSELSCDIWTSTWLSCLISSSGCLRTPSTLNRSQWRAMLNASKASVKWSATSSQNDTSRNHLTTRSPRLITSESKSILQPAINPLQLRLIQTGFREFYCQCAYLFS